MTESVYLVKIHTDARTESTTLSQCPMMIKMVFSSLSSQGEVFTRKSFIVNVRMPKEGKKL